MTIEKLQPITVRCIQPGGVWYEVMPQDIAGYRYYYAECVQMGRVFHVTSAMETEHEVESYVTRLYPNANRYQESE